MGFFLIHVYRIAKVKGKNLHILCEIMKCQPFWTY